MLGEKQEREETPTREGRKGRATRVPHKAGKSAQCHLLQPWPGTQLETAQPQLETQLEMAQPRPGTQLEAQPRGARAYPTVQTTHHTPGHSADPRCILHPRTLQKEPLAMGKETPWATPSPLSHTQDTASTTGIIPFPSLLHSSSLETLTKLSELRSLPGSAELQNSLGTHWCAIATSTSTPEEYVTSSKRSVLACGSGAAHTSPITTACAVHRHSAHGCWPEAPISTGNQGHQYRQHACHGGAGMSRLRRVRLTAPLVPSF